MKIQDSQAASGTKPQQAVMRTSMGFTFIAGTATNAYAYHSRFDLAQMSGFDGVLWAVLGIILGAILIFACKGDD